MSGHSKWASIKHRKAAQDAKKGKIFSKLAKEITIAAKFGGGNPENNPRLRLAIERAKEYNMPSDNIKKAIQRGTGELPGAVVEEVIYEGYGPGGVAFFIEALSDNKNRTTAQIRRIFSQAGGSLGESGCVSWMFDKKGYITIAKGDIEEEKLFDIVTEAGAEDFKSEGEDYEIITSVENFEKIKREIEKVVKPKYANITILPKSYMQVDAKVAKSLLSLIDALEEDEDVKEVYTNFEIPDEVLRTLK
jgi:YebC/PmpR family DNA-binding regulatory protein